MSEIKPTVYLDIHGVLADFVGGVGDLYGIHDLTGLWAKDMSSHESLHSVVNEALKNPADKMLLKRDVEKRISAEGATFWSSLFSYGWAEDLYNYLNKRFDVLLVSSPYIYPPSATGILNWASGFVGGSNRNCIICPTELKYRLSQRGCILIDDYNPTISTFGEHGGKGILFPMPWNIRGVAGGFDEVVKVLHKVERYVESLKQDDQESPVIFT